MRPFLILMLPLFALISGCQTTNGASVCDGWKALRPSLETSVFIAKADRPFANQVAAHNRFGKSQGCWK